MILQSDRKRSCYSQAGISIFLLSFKRSGTFNSYRKILMPAPAFNFAWADDLLPNSKNVIIKKSVNFLKLISH
jgi:hypothetical protein